MSARSWHAFILLLTPSFPFRDSHIPTNHHGFSGVAPQKAYHHQNHTLLLARARTSLLRGKQQTPHREDSSSQPRRNRLQDHADRAEARHSNRRRLQRRRQGFAPRGNRRRGHSNRTAAGAAQLLERSLHRRRRNSLRRAGKLFFSSLLPLLLFVFG